MSQFLLVEDNSVTCRVLARFFERGGHQLDCVEGGHKAIEYLRQNMLPDAMILDCVLPDFDGINVLKAVRADPHNHHLPIILYTAVDDPALHRAALKCGATDVWVKASIEPQQMLDRLSEIADSNTPHCN